MVTRFVMALFVTEVFGGWIKYFPKLCTKVIFTAPVEQVFEKAPATRLDEILNGYYSVANKCKELNVVSQIHQIDSNNVKYKFYDFNGKTLVVVKTIRHRNKRYTRYLTLCPFKICNMGRKRTYLYKKVHYDK